MYKLIESVEVHDELNPKLWNGLKLLPDVSEALKNIADEFQKFVDIPLNIVDIEIVGSNAGYNYTDNSDIDLHIIVNTDLTYTDPAILQQLYNARKGSFNDNYDLEVNGLPVELYIEDLNSGNATNGRYSLIKDDWVVTPVKQEIQLPDISDELITYQEKCADMLKSDNAQQIQDFINELYMMRKVSLSKDGEFSKGNLIFKELRNLNMLQDLKDRYYELKSKELSLD